jgi:hypothetical protein
MNDVVSLVVHEVVGRVEQLRLRRWWQCHGGAGARDGEGGVFRPWLVRERKGMGRLGLDGSWDAPLRSGQLAMMPGHARRVEYTQRHCPTAGRPLKFLNGGRNRRLTEEL